MCWNQYVSINTFAFGIFVLLLVAFNNQYSSYKIEFFKNSYAYLFVLSVISMQFIEFLLWRNINNPLINNIVSTFGLIILTLQPFTSLLLINDIKLRNNLLTIYSVPTLLFLIYTIYTTNIHTEISKLRHLSWYYWTNSNVPLLNILALIFYLIFLFLPLIYNKYYQTLVFLFIFLVIKYYYYKDRSANSLWCFFVNIVMLYFLIKILLVLPFNEMVSNKK
jgi:hypothetical protein